MLQYLTKTLRFNSGFHSKFLAKQMNDFKPIDEDDIIKKLSQISPKKEYIESDSIADSFYNRIEQFLLRKNGVSSKTLHIYQYLKQMDELRPRFKYGIHKKLTNELQKVLIGGLTIKNNELQVLLWFLYRQFPFYRNSKFQDIGANSTLKLFDMHEYMTQAKRLPKWEPYIRITTMLQCLGHNPTTRCDITHQEIKNTQLSYYPYLSNIFPDTQSFRAFQSKYSITEPFLVHLYHEFIAADKLKYDKYMYHVQTIDNEEAHENVEKVSDVLSWDYFIEILELYAKTINSLEGQIDTNLAFEMGELFWRLCQSKNPDLETCVRIIELLSTNNRIYSDLFSNIIHRTKDSVISADNLDYRFLPSQAYLQMIQSCLSLRASNIQPQAQKEMIDAFIKHIPQSKLWEPEDGANIKSILQEKKIIIPQTIQKILEGSN